LKALAVTPFYFHNSSFRNHSRTAADEIENRESCSDVPIRPEGFDAPIFLGKSHAAAVIEHDQSISLANT
jgi:hypothetical protein